MTEAEIFGNSPSTCHFSRISSSKVIRSRTQSGNSKVLVDFFSHVAPLRSFTWSGVDLGNSHWKAFTSVRLTVGLFNFFNSTYV